MKFRSFETLPRDRSLGPKTSLTVLGLIFFVAVFTWSSDLSADAVYKIDGTVIRNVNITRATWKVVSFQQGKVPQSVEAAEVERLDRKSKVLSQAKSLIGKGNYAAAKRKLEDAKKVGDEWQAAEASYLIGHVYLSWAAIDSRTLKKAVKAFEKTIKDYSPSEDFYVPHAHLGLARALEFENKPKLAQVHYGDLERFGGIWKYRGRIGAARSIVQARGDASSAQKIFNQVINDDKSPADAKEEAAVGSGLALVQMDRFDEAQRLLDRSFFNPRGGSIRYNENYAHACNVMGQVFMGKKDADSAELWFLRTTCFFRNQPIAFRAAVKHLVSLYEDNGKSKRAGYWKSQLGGRKTVKKPESRKSRKSKKNGKKRSKKRNKKKDRDATR